jgi:uncharacterized protein (TIGR02246 family)
VNDVERLVALEEIRALITRYSITYDDHDWDAFGELWTEDAAFVVNGRAFEGREVMLEFLTTCLPEDYFGKHVCSPSLVELGSGGDTATAQTDVLWIAQNFENSIVGRYDDTFARRDGRWLFSRREESTVPFRPGFPPYSEAALAVSGPTMRSPTTKGA